MRHSFLGLRQRDRCAPESDTLASQARSAASSWDCACSNSVFAFSTNGWDISYSIGLCLPREPATRRPPYRSSLLELQPLYSIAEIHCASRKGGGRALKLFGFLVALFCSKNLGQKDAPHDRQRPLRRLARRQRSIRPCVNASMQVQEVRLQVLGVFGPRHLVDARRGGLLQSEESRPQNIDADMMQERGQLASYSWLQPLVCEPAHVTRLPGSASDRGLLVRILLIPAPWLHLLLSSHAASFAGFTATMGRSDFSGRVHRRLRPPAFSARSLQNSARAAKRSPGSRAEGVSACQIPWGWRRPALWRMRLQPHTLETAMDVVAHQPEAPGAIRSDLGAIFVSLELSRSTWLITSLSPCAGEKMSKHGVAAGDIGALLARFSEFKQKAFARTGKSFPIIVIQEAGLDGFWIYRVLQSERIESHVVDPASIATSRRRRRAKTDRIDGEALLRALLAYKRGEPRVCAMVKAPTPEEEDRRRLSRERKTLIGERVEHVNRIKGLLFCQGVSDYEPLRRDRRQRLDELKTGDGRALPDHLKAQISRELDRLELLLEQIKAVEAGQNTLFAAAKAEAPTPAPVTMC